MILSGRWMLKPARFGSADLGLEIDPGVSEDFDLNRAAKDIAIYPVLRMGTVR